MNLTLENIQLAVDQADRFMEANGSDRQKRLIYRLLPVQIMPPLPEPVLTVVD